LKFLATWQDVATTKQRADDGECWVAVLNDCLVGTITVYRPGMKHNCPLFDRPGVASFGQFAVDPSIQLRGVGSALENLAEERATELGATEMVIDTAEPAETLRRRYERRGYRVIGVTRWNVTNYHSVVSSKTLKPSSTTSSGCPP
jgi:GNAT superfamily N-acetyltransferase